MKILKIGQLSVLLSGLLLLTGANAEVAMGQSLGWAKQAGGANLDIVNGIAIDSAGNSSLTGIITGTATFGEGEANEATITSSDSSDVFVARYNPSGEFLWVRQVSGPSETRGEAISVDGAGNSYVTGVFRFSVTFHDGTTFDEFAPGVSDLFVAKYNSSGNLVWARQAGLDFIPGVIDVGKHGRGISVDNAGNSYLSGQFGTDLGETALFVAKYDTNGTLLWVRHANNDGVNPSLVSSSSISVDGAGNSYATGHFMGSITFGPGEVNQTVLTGIGSLDVFVAKYNNSGALLWARRSGGAGVSAEGTGISVDSTGNSHVTGIFGGTVTFGLGETNETTLTTVPIGSLFLAKYDTAGELQWARQAFGPGNSTGLAISVDSAGNSHVTGEFGRLNTGAGGAVTFGAGEINETVLIGAGGHDIFVAKYHSSGELLWIKQVGSPGGESGRGIAADNNGNSYVAGSISSDVTFGLGEANETTLTVAPDAVMDIFIAKYQNDSVTQPPGTEAQINAVIVTIDNSNLISAGIKTSLNAKLRAALAAIRTGDVPTACSKLQDFLNHVRAQRGKKIPVDLADTLIISVSAIRSELGCT